MIVGVDVEEDDEDLKCPIEKRKMKNKNQREYSRGSRTNQKT
jgi:hypothetical protein